MLTVGYIGFGVSVRYYHLPYVLGREDIRVKKIYRSGKSRDEAREARYEGIEFTDRVEDIAEDEEIDLVVIATPNAYHVSYGKQMLLMGKHVLIEKPIAPTAEEAGELYALAEEKGLVVYTNLNRRYDGDFRTLKEILDSGVLGDIVEIEAKYDYWHPAATPRLPYFYNMGIHFIDQMVHLFGSPKKLVPYVHSYNQVENGCDFFDITMLYENMRVSVSTSVFVKQESPRFVVYGKKGSLVKYGSYHVDKSKEAPLTAEMAVEPEENWSRLEVVDEYGNTIRYQVPTKPTDYGKVYEDVAGAISGEKPKQTKEEVLEVLRILDECAACAD